MIEKVMVVEVVVVKLKKVIKNQKNLFVTPHVFFTTRPNEDGTTYQAFLLL